MKLHFIRTVYLSVGHVDSMLSFLNELKEDHKDSYSELYLEELEGGDCNLFGVEK